MRYNDALESGLLPDQFWGMSLREVKDTVYSRFKQRQRDIYALSARVRVAVLSCFSEETTFPPPPSFDNETQGINVARDVCCFLTRQFRRSKGFCSASGFVNIGIAIGVTKIYQLDIVPVTGNKNILGFQVVVYNLMLVDKSQGIKQFIENAFLLFI